MIDKPPMDPFFERTLIGMPEEYKRQAYEQRRNQELTEAAANLLENDQEQGE